MPVRKGRLLVEGKDDKHVVWGLCESYGVPQTFDVKDAEGLDPLLDLISVQLRGSGIERVGVVADADSEVASRWASIERILRTHGYEDVPSAPVAEGTIVLQSGKPVVGVWLMPDNTTAGMLEDFVAALIPARDPLLSRAADAVDNIPVEERRFSPAHRSKALIHTWLSWQEEPGSPMGQAIGKRDLDAEAPHAQRFMRWLTRLMVDAPPAAPDLG
ncbi:MAG TPA: DUF3226 domain-containing protein [Longimicrobium sp.]|jgi:hypothetical protein|uniref:DUF3226 domain-containing protein n=1 Tax=Longimicrobium sp. TaxID=2029185 RepID=UPI002ED98ACC